MYKSKANSSIETKPNFYARCTGCGYGCEGCTTACMARCNANCSGSIGPLALPQQNK